MHLTSGSRLGPYEIVSRAGAGGMGEVWKARDTRLDRTVAVKILPSEFADDAHLKVRFEREAKTISQLEHPNICRLYDVGDGYLVMEWLEGEVLADRLAKGPLPLADVLKYGSQIAEALHRAHRAGVTHRDLKPGNVIITKSGAKLLDFGLAKSSVLGGGLVPAPSSVDGATQQKPLTEQGTIVGTFQYMAPEQLEGTDVDGRADIFALGAVLYEMTTGKRAFEGKTRTSLIAAIVKEQPRPISELQPMTPPALEHVVAKCLAKDPEERWQSAGDVAEELRWIGEAGSKAGVAKGVSLSRRSRERVAWGVAALWAIVAAVFAAGYVRRAPRVSEPVRLMLLPPVGHSIDIQSDLLGQSLSPDGSRLAFVTSGKDGKRSLWIRRLSENTATPVPETEGASYPFWSPDGQAVAFFADAKLKRVNLAGGSPTVICNAPSGRGGTWGPDGTIVFAPSLRSGIYKVPSSGGQPVAVVPDDEHTSYRWPHFLPDGKRFLYVARAQATSNVGQVWAASIEGGPPKLVASDASNGVYLRSGHLLFGRGDDLMIQKFDVKSLRTSGEPVVLFPQKVAYFEPKNYSYFTASESALVYVPSRRSTVQMAWYGREGQQIETFGPAGYLYGIDIAPDDRRIAYVSEPRRAQGDIWIYDVPLRREIRLTYESGAFGGFLQWSPDGSRMAYTHVTKAIPDLFVKPVAGGASQSLVVSSYWKAFLGWFPDGKRLAFGEQNPSSNYDLWAVSLDDRKRQLLLQTPYEEANPSPSPDGRWLSYRSNESGRVEVYVRPLDGTAAQTQVSDGGGTFPFWRGDGKELFYIGPGSSIMAVDMSGRLPGAPRALFRIPERAEIWDTTSDGKKFLLTLPTEERQTAAFEVVLDWQELLRKK